MSDDGPGRVVLTADAPADSFSTTAAPSGAASPEGST